MSETHQIEPLLTKQQVAELLGITETWLNTEIQSGNISHLRLGRKKYIRFRQSHVLEYLESRERPATANNKEEELDGDCPCCGRSTDRSGVDRVLVGEETPTDDL